MKNSNLINFVLLTALTIMFSTYLHADQFPEEILDQMEIYAVQQMETHDIPGLAYCIVYNDEIVYMNSFGTTEYQGNTPVDNYTLFQIGSVSKSFTSSLFAKYIDRGFFSWNTKISELLPEFLVQDPWVSQEFVISDLFSQSTSFPPYSLDLMALLGFNRYNIIQAMKHIDPVYSFRSSFSYVNVTYLIASKIIEKLSPLNWERALKREILLPLEMYDTTADMSEIESHSNKSKGHMVRQNGQLFIIPEDWRYRHTLDTISPAGGIYSNISDMAQYLRFHLNRGSINGLQLISEDNLKYTHATKTFIERDSFENLHMYGLGWTYSDISPHYIISHNGITFGMHSLMALIPESNLGLIVLTNTNQNPATLNLLNMLYNLYFFQNDPKDIISNNIHPFHSEMMPMLYENIHKTKEVKIDSKSLSEYKGVYRNPAYGRVRILLEDNQLRAIIGNVNYEIDSPLVFIGNNNFIFNIPDFPDSLIMFSFHRLPGGQVRRLYITGFEDVNRGFFNRVMPVGF